jgi:hypothetical protein
MSTTRIASAPLTSDAPEWLELVKRQVNSLRYGVVQMVVHDAQVTQVEKTERGRLAPKN